MIEANQIALLESILFLSPKPLATKELAKATGLTREIVVEAAELLRLRYDRQDSGLRLFMHDDTYQIVSNPDHASAVEAFYHAELSGELTKPALETLTIVAYRGPITKPELELIRGVNCSLILRNLLMRGLVNQRPGTEGDDLLAQYTVSPEFLQYLGFTSVQQLPKFDELHSHQLLEELLKQRAQTL